MDTIPTSPYLRPIVQTLALSATSLLAGQISLFSTALIPAIRDTPEAEAVAIWENAWSLGASYMPPQAFACSLLWGYLSYTARRSNTARTLYAVAALLTPSIAPFTLIIMGRVNDSLHLRAKKLANFNNYTIEEKKAKIQSAEEEIKDAEVRKMEREKSLPELFSIWKGLNAMRAIMMGAAAVCGAVAMVGAEGFGGLR